MSLPVAAIFAVMWHVARLLMGISLLYAQQPRLVVGIVVDQMRADYLRRFIPKRSQGFGKLISEGLVYWNGHYTYFPTYTGPGHASVYTGTTPAHHGIVANDWWERESGRFWYCTEDTAVRPVGAEGAHLRRSPRPLWASTICDELRYSSRFRSKTIGIALKDRSAILPIGRSGSLALWFDAQSGQWVTSTYYRDTLPAWVERFNARKYPDSLLRLPWKRVHAALLCEDESPYEATFKGVTATTFPHQPSSYKELLYTPAGNWLTLQLAKEAIAAERLGRGPTPDFLAISLSSPDLAGHFFGTESCELEELYRELDRSLADFLNYLSRRFRREEVLLFLTADHGASPTPEALAERGWNAGRYPEAQLLEQAQHFLRGLLGLVDPTKPIAAFVNQNFYFSPHLSLAQRQQAAAALKNWLLDQPHIIAAYTREELSGPGGTAYAFQMLQAGFLPLRSGDVVVVYAPGWIEGGYAYGTTHGSIWTYDTHVPIVWWGGGIRARWLFERVPITAIAPTLAFLLSAPLPSATTTAPLTEVIQNWRLPLPPPDLHEAGGNN